MKTSILIFSLVLVQSAISQIIDSSFGYYPIQVGDIRQYSYNILISDGTVYNYSEIVTGDTIAQNNKKYFVVIHTNLSDKSSYKRYLRIDTSTANVYLTSDLSSTFESLSDSLRSKSGDQFGITRCTGVTQKTILGYLTTVKSFSTSVYYRHELAFGIGRITDWEDKGFPYASTLLYAKINNKEYGTPLVVKQTNEIITQYHLEQNYPNPFNPSTNIRFSIPTDEMVKISIYNLMGQELEVILNSFESSGNHKIMWNASKYSSGVYFYQMKTRNVIRTKSLLLIK